MSKAYPGVSSSREAFTSYINTISKFPQVLEIYLIGSRSPRNPKEPKPDSDWDIHVVSTVKLLVMHPRRCGIVNGDVGNMTKEEFSTKSPNPWAVQVYPKDTHDMLVK